MGKMKIVYTEALDNNQRNEVDYWSKGDNSFSDHVFKNSLDNNRVYIPLEYPRSRTEHEIHRHLSTIGFKIKNYKEGLATDRHGRDIKIGKILMRANKDKLLDKYQKDPARAAQHTHNDHMVMISRHPHDVAGMSTNTNWHSCLSWDGCNNKYLPHEVKHGTHVAYLIHKNDPEAKDPVARIALKPFDSINIVSHTRNYEPHKILRPETRHYGNAPDAFSHTVNKWVEHHFPGHSDKIYKIHDAVYKDSKHDFIIPKKAMSAALKSPSLNIKLAAIASDHISSNHLHKILAGDDIALHMPAAINPRLSDRHRRDLLLNDDLDQSTNMALFKGMKRPHKIIHNLLQGDKVPLKDAVGIPTFPLKHVKTALDIDPKAYRHFHSKLIARLPSKHIDYAHKSIMDSVTKGVSYNEPVFNYSHRFNYKQAHQLVRELAKHSDLSGNNEYIISSLLHTNENNRSIIRNNAAAGIYGEAGSRAALDHYDLLPRSSRHHLIDHIVSDSRHNAIGKLLSKHTYNHDIIDPETHHHLYMKMHERGMINKQLVDNNKLFRPDSVDTGNFTHILFNRGTDDTRNHLVRHHATAVLSNINSIHADKVSEHHLDHFLGMNPETLEKYGGIPSNNYQERHIQGLITDLKNRPNSRFLTSSVQRLSDADKLKSHHIHDILRHESKEPGVTHVQRNILQSNKQVERSHVEAALNNPTLEHTALHRLSLMDNEHKYKPKTESKWQTSKTWLLS